MITTHTPGRINRRQFLKYAGGAGACVFAGSLLNSRAALGQFAGKRLRVVGWSGPYAEDIQRVFGDSFERKYGAKVELRGGWIEMVDLIVAAPANDPPFDLTVADGQLLLRGMGEGTWLPIRYENVPNSKDVFQAYWDFDKLDSRDSQYGAPFGFSHMLTGWNKEVFQFMPDSWHDYWRPEVQGTIALDQGYWDFPVAAAAFHVAQATGYPNIQSMYHADGLDAIMKAMAELDVALWYGGGADCVAALERGDVDFAETYLQDICTLSQRDPRFDYVIPKEGTVGYVDYYSVVRGTPERDLAEAFINHLLDPEFQSEFSRVQYYWLSNAKTVIDPDPRKAFIPRTNEEIARLGLDFDQDYLVANWSMIEERLKREVWNK